MAPDLSGSRGGVAGRRPHGNTLGPSSHDSGLIGPRAERTDGTNTLDHRRRLFVGTKVDTTRPVSETDELTSREGRIGKRSE